jgi:hypothetical protein
MTAPIEGSAKITLEPMTLAPVRPVDAYLATAEAIVPSLDVLRESNLSAIPGALLAGHALECLLKAVLAQSGLTEAELRSSALRHNLEELWRRSGQHLPLLGTSLPDWATRLSELHNSPYVLRYPVGLHGLVLPNPASVATELSKLRDAVRELVRGSGA